MSLRRSMLLLALASLTSCSSAPEPDLAAEEGTRAPSPAIGATSPRQVEAETAVLVAPAPAQSDDLEDLAITRAIQEGIVADAALPLTAHGVVVLTRGAMVTLSGEVGADADRTAIERIAWDAVGVRTVENRITLSN
jgi:hypothetical protein